MRIAEDWSGGSGGGNAPPRWIDHTNTMSLDRLSNRAFIRQFVTLFALMALLTGCLPSRPAIAPRVEPSRTRAALDLAGHDLVQHLPLQITENRGQLDPGVAYYVNGRDASVYFTADGLTIAVARPGQASDVTERWAIRLDFVGAHPATPVGTEQSSAVLHDLRGRPEAWRTNLRSFGGVTYADLWPGIDLAYRSGADELKYELLVQPHADVSQVGLAYRGVSSVELTEAGDLQISTPLGSFHDAAPYAYQEADGRRVDVPAAYRLERDGDVYRYGIEVGAYDPALALVIDPAVPVYAGFVGGLGREEARAIAVDGDGYAYVAGSTIDSGATFPLTIGPDTSYNGNGDVFVAKLRPDGSGLVYSAYLGGTGVDEGFGIAVDGAGSAYVVGASWSADGSFPTVIGPSLTYAGGDGDGFITKLGADGSRAYSGFIGGADVDEARGVTVDVAGNAYVTGYTLSPSPGFPTLVGPDTDYNGDGDAFVVKVRSDGTGLTYAGYIGGSSFEEGRAIAVDEAGSAYVTGYTLSTQSTFPARGGPDVTANDRGDMFVAKVETNGSGFVYAGFVGGSDFDEGNGIAVGQDGSVWLTGSTWSGDFPAVGAPRVTGASGEATLVKVAPTGASLLLATTIGGDGEDLGRAIALDRRGNVYVTGSSTSSDDSFPVVGGPATRQNGGDAFVARLALLPDLSAAIQDVPAETTVGAPFNVVVAVENRDTVGAGATDVTVTVRLPSGLQLASASATQRSCGPQSGVVVCRIGTVVSRATARVTLRVTPQAPGAVQLGASVAAHETDADPANNAATASTTVRLVACTPRPNVKVTTARGAPGELVATVTVTTSAGSPTNQLREIKLGAPVNARVETGSQRNLTAPTTVPFPTGTQSATVTVHRVTPGQAVTVPLTVVDTCGEWRTFVGGGPAAY